MKPIVLALILSITLHLLAFYSLKQKNIEPPREKPALSKQEKKHSVTFVKLKPKKIEEKKPVEKPKKEPIKKQLFKPINKEFKKVTKVKKQPKRSVKKKITKKAVKKVPKKTIPQKETKPNFEKMNPTKLQKNMLDSFLAEPTMKPEYLDEITKSYLKEYGDEFESFTKVQKVFIKNNLRTIVEITVAYYTWPEEARKFRVDGRNVVEFILHPNGDMTNLRIKTPSEYVFYDKRILETIRIAYKDYPRPKQKTKIIFYINYLPSGGIFKRH